MVKSSKEASDSQAKPSKSKVHWFIKLTSILLFVAGIPMFIGGFVLLFSGGTFWGWIYYILAGAGLSYAGYELWNGRMRGVFAFLIVFVVTLIWALIEVGFSFWALVPRLVAPIFMGAMVLFAVHFLPARQRPLEIRPYMWGGVAMSAAFVIYLVAMFFPHDIIRNKTELDIREYTGDTSPNWEAWGRTGGGDRYAPFDQITKDNIDQLEVAWTANTGFIADQRQFEQDQNTPLYVDGTLYHCGPVGQISAIDGTTGEIKWQYDPKAGSSDWKRCRSLGYFDPGAGDDCGPRVYMTTVDARLIALRTDNGEKCESFGNAGEVDVWIGMGDVNQEYLTGSSGPVVANGKVIFGGRVTDNVERGEPSGVIRAYDALTGEIAWVWDLGNPDLKTEPGPGEFYTPGTPNAWSLLSFDEELEMVYIPLGGATPDIYGGLRRDFDDEYSGAVVALDTNTGDEIWKFQTTYHDLWDYDIPSQPVLADIPDGEGGYVPGLIMTTKRAQVFVLDRRTGEPIKAVEDKPVAQGDGSVEGEYYAEKQPYSTEMAAIGGEELTEKMMWGATPIDQLMCRILFNRYDYRGDFTPPSAEKWNIPWPGPLGGYNLGSTSIDKERDVMVSVEMRFTMVSRLLARDDVPKDAEYTGEDGAYFPMDYTPYALERKPFVSPINIPCIQPPWGTVSAIDLETGEHIWQYPAGTAKDLAIGSFKPHLGFFVGLPPMAGPIVTKGGIAWYAGSQDYYLRAFDVETGDLLWKGRLPLGSQSTPLSYVGEDGRQYIVVNASGARGNMSEFGDHVVAFALPDGSENEARGQ